MDLYSQLTQEENQLLIDAIPLITILVGEADGDLDKQEKEWAKKITEIRTYNAPETLLDYYKIVGEQYDSQLNTYLDTLPNILDDKMQQIGQKLSQLNEVFPKLENNTAADLYESMVSFAHHVAKASGGILRFWNVSNEERAVMDLPMITPIIREEEA